MSERPTPETDDQPTINAINDEGYAVPCVDIEFARKLERERDEAREELSSIHRWIERNHADGFIDSLTFLQNLERVVDCWYDRIDEAREKIKRQASRIRELEGATNHAGGIKKSESPQYHGTPETDAMVERWQNSRIPADFSRRMETERNEARRLADTRLTQLLSITSSEPKDYLGLVVACRVHKDHIAQLIKERDEAREAAERWESSSDDMERAGAEQARRADENREWALKAERERDEARDTGERLSKQGLDMMDQNRSLKSERDEMRELLKSAQNALDAIHLEVGGWLKKLIEYK